jgi:dephospho-CoA kinase
LAIRVGLTGGIGSGKSVVARIFEAIGIPVYYADEAAKKIQNSDPEVREQIIKVFGTQAYTTEGMDRKFISSVVFSDTSKLEQLNAIVHPATLRDAAQWLADQTAPYAIKEAALVFESGAHHDLDVVIGVSAPIPLRIKRTIERDSITEEEVRKRMSKQINDTVKMKLCEFVVYNDEKQLLIPQVLAIHHQLLSYPKRSNP